MLRKLMPCEPWVSLRRSKGLAASTFTCQMTSTCSRFYKSPRSIRFGARIGDVELKRCPLVAAFPSSFIMPDKLSGERCYVSTSIACQISPRLLAAPRPLIYKDRLCDYHDRLIQLLEAFECRDVSGIVFLQSTQLTIQHPRQALWLA